MAPLGIAILGAGIFVTEQHLPAVLAIPNLLSLKAVYSRTANSARTVVADLKDVPIYSDDSVSEQSLKALLERSDVQAVIIALPIMKQVEVIKLCLAAGKAVLSEKPIAPTMQDARELMRWHQEHASSVIWGVAENFRFLEAFVFAAKKARELGRTLGFNVQISAMVERGGKYFETAWRKVPEYQGGFILDGGVHCTAGLRLLLGDENPVLRVSAFTALSQEHLPPVDSLTATLKATSGIGVFELYFGSTRSTSSYNIACQDGTVTVSRDKVTWEKYGSKEEESKQFPEDQAGVSQEVKAFAEALTKGEAHPLQAPILAYKDLELVESFLKSGEQNGVPIDIESSKL